MKKLFTLSLGLFTANTVLADPVTNTAAEQEKSEVNVAAPTLQITASETAQISSAKNLSPAEIAKLPIRQQEEIYKAAYPAIQQSEIINALGMVFIEIPAGSFMMGTDEESAKKNEKPQHAVSIEKPFYLGRFEVTQEQWEDVMGEDPHSRRGENIFYKMMGKECQFEPENPVMASWNDAQEFIKKLNEQDKEYQYRLPTEAEWEYAARGGKDPKFFIDLNQELLSEYCWFDVSLDQDTHPVGLKKPTRWGLYDICGNVGEWVEDNYRPDYNPDSKPTNKKIVRGGSWHTSAEKWRPTTRYPKDPDYRSKTIGFRLVAEKKED